MVGSIDYSTFIASADSRNEASELLSVGIPIVESNWIALQSGLKYGYHTRERLVSRRELPIGSVMHGGILKRFFRISVGVFRDTLYGLCDSTVIQLEV